MNNIFLQDKATLENTKRCYNLRHLHSLRLVIDPLVASNFSYLQTDDRRYQQQMLTIKNATEEKNVNIII